MPQRIIQLSPDLIKKVEDEAERRQLRSSSDCIILILEEYLAEHKNKKGVQK